MPPRVAVDYRPALLTPTGIGRAVRELCRALAARGDLDLHLFGHCFAPARIPAPPPPHSRLHRLPIPGRAHPWLARRGLGADHLAGRAAVFHWTDYVHPPVARARVVLTVHDLAFVEDPAWHGSTVAAELLERTRRAAARADRVVVPSEATADDARRHLDLDDGRLRVVPFGADHVSGVTGPHPLRGRPYLVTVGTIEPRKNHLRLLASWRRLGPDRPHLVVIGRRGWRCDETVEALEAVTEEGSLTWIQDADDATLFAWLGHAMALVYPSLSEGFGFPPLEAMALGVPVLCSETPALVQLTREAALRVDATDSAALTAALARLVGDGDLRRALGEAGRGRARQLTWATTATAYADVYRELAG